MLSPPSAPVSSLFSLTARIIVLLVLWCVLAEQWPGHDVPLVLVFVAAALVTSLRLRRPTEGRLRGLRLLSFLPWFLGQSLVGGIDVARRALSPRLPLAPAFVDLPVPSPGGRAVVLLAWTLSLLPGTAAVQLHGRTLRVHVLDRSRHTLESLQAIQRRVRHLFVE